MQHHDSLVHIGNSSKPELMHEGVLQAGEQRHHSKFDPVWQLNQVVKLQAPSGRHDWDPLQGMLKLAHSWVDHRQASTCLLLPPQPVPGILDLGSASSACAPDSRI